jgi:hypothetical protein
MILNIFFSLKKNNPHKRKYFSLENLSSCTQFIPSDRLKVDNYQICLTIHSTDTSKIKSLENCMRFVIILFIKTCEKDKIVSKRNKNSFFFHFLRMFRFQKEKRKENEHNCSLL